MNRTMHTYRSFATPAAVALVAGGLLALPQDATVADALVDQADPTKTIRASSTPGLGDLITSGDTISVDTAKKRVGINKASADTNLHVYGNFRVWSNHKLTDNIAQGAVQMCDINYTRGWSADPTGFQSYGGVLELNPRGLNPVEVNNALRVMPNGFVGLGVENPAVPFDMQGAFRTNDTIVSTKPAGAPFQVASTDLSTNLNADLLDGHHADDFVLESELAALLADAAPTASAPSDPRPETDSGLADLDAGVVFPDGTVQTTAALPGSSSAQAIGSAVFELAGAQGQAVTVSTFVTDLELEVAAWKGGPVVELRITKPVDEASFALMSGLFLLGGGPGSLGDSLDVFDPVGDLTLLLPDLHLTSTTGGTSGVELFLEDVQVLSVRTRNVTPPSKGNQFEGLQPTSHLVEDVVLRCWRLRITESSQSLELELDQGLDVSGDHSTFELRADDLSALRAVDYSVARDEGGLSTGSSTPGPRVVLRELDLALLHSACVSRGFLAKGAPVQPSLTSALVESPAQVGGRSGGVVVPDGALRIELEDAWAASFRLSARHDGGFDVEARLDGQEQTWTRLDGEGQVLSSATWGPQGFSWN